MYTTRQNTRQKLEQTNKTKDQFDNQTAPAYQFPCCDQPKH